MYKNYNGEKLLLLLFIIYFVKKQIFIILTKFFYIRAKNYNYEVLFVLNLKKLKLFRLVC